MSQYGNLARQSSGVVVSGKSDVFFLEEESAKKCVEKYGGTIEKLDDGWLVSKTYTEPSNDDPLIQVIRKSLIDAGLIKAN